MNIGQRVEYQIGHGEYGYGKLIEIREVSETAVVEDEVDGSTWVGNLDHLQPAESTDNPG